MSSLAPPPPNLRELCALCAKTPHAPPHTNSFRINPYKMARNY